jgi:hypothetical protein
MRPRRAHLEVDQREGEGLERVVVAEEGAQPRPESERRQARAAGHPEPPGRRSAVGSGVRSRRGGERGGGIRRLFRRGSAAEENLLSSDRWLSRPSLFCVKSSARRTRASLPGRLGRHGLNFFGKRKKTSSIIFAFGEFRAIEK